MVVSISQAMTPGLYRAAAVFCAQGIIHAVTGLPQNPQESIVDPSKLPAPAQGARLTLTLSVT
ncbi:hypothetical protein DM813_11385 [Pseudomonas alkylphenolica]|uniref:Uncharacterized protein n=1 Tax=Pseudomonas alkylphenolica TaxID=237609 RepID=A0A443ZSW8_9PSED|nr:hypothetical protein DM813_11385 [Pseudomonas alkylphenolica]